MFGNKLASDNCENDFPTLLLTNITIPHKLKIKQQFDSFGPQIRNAILYYKFFAIRHHPTWPTFLVVTHVTNSLAFIRKREAWTLVHLTCKMAVTPVSKHFEMSFKIPCGSIQAKIWGKVGGRPVLGLHGWLDNANTFDKLAPLLPEDVHFVAIDLPGHGKSSRKPKGVSTYDWVVDIKRVVTHLSWKKFSLICHSMSGLYGTLYAGTFPMEVENLILLDGYVGTPTLGEPPDVLAEHTKAMLEDTAPPVVYPDFESLVAKKQQQGWGLDKLSTKILAARRTVPVPGGISFTVDPLNHISEVMPVMFLRNPLDITFEMLISFLKRISCNVFLLVTSEISSIFQFTASSKRFKHFSDAIQNHGSLTFRIVPGNHYVHLNSPHIIMPMINLFLSYSNFVYSSRL